MWAAILPVIGFLFQIILQVVTHALAKDNKKVDAKTVALKEMADAAKRSDYDAFLDSLASFHSN